MSLLTPTKDEVEVTDQVLEELGLPTTSTKTGDTLFLKGPIPLAWLARVNVGANTAVVALAVVVASDMGRGQSGTVQRSIWRQLGLSPRARRRALNALERAGIIRIERTPGKPVRIRLRINPRSRRR
jgi:hypothetical protein